MAYAGRREILKATVAVVTAMVGGGGQSRRAGIPKRDQSIWHKTSSFMRSIVSGRCSSALRAFGDLIIIRHKHRCLRSRFAGEFHDGE